MSEIEARPYGPEITEAERTVLKARVTLLGDDIIYWNEAPVTTTYQLDVFEEKLKELTQELDAFYMLVDLCDTVRPSPEIIDHLRKIMSAQIKARHAAIYTGKNILLNVAVKFVMSRIGFASFSINKTRDEALEAIQNAR